jgi:hypothetical protein
MKLLDFRYNNEDVISTDKILFFCRNMNIEYFKTDLLNYDDKELFLYFRDKIYKNPKSTDTYPVVVGHSDYSIDDTIYSKYSFKTWFCVNKNTRKDNVFSIPLGITNDCDDTHIHRIYGNTNVFFDVLNTEKTFKNLVYMNFNISTNPQKRIPLYNTLLNKNFVSIGNIENTMEGRKKFLTDIYNHKFVLCPVGNGLDTHRIWETLYMKSIPIVLKDIYIEEHSDLPILMLDSWDEINEEFLNRKYEEIISKEWNLDKLKVDYWFNFIKLKLNLS